jgi:putative flavoprotein involved in K+ transport
MYWAVETGMFDQTLADLPSPSARLVSNIQATGQGGGHDLHYRVLQRIGVTLLGHFLGAGDGRAQFASDLATSVAFGDARHNEMREKIAKFCAAAGIRSRTCQSQPRLTREPRSQSTSPASGR